MSEKILAEYDENLSLYEAYTKKVGGLIEEILHENNINVHSVTYRVKDRASLNKKLLKEGKNYTQLKNITDIAGIRITTYLEDDVEKVAQLIKKEFNIDSKNSVDKKTLLDPDRFGYLSLHHVIALSSERCKLTEYRRFPELKAEVQTRSILQHAWAEIEHDLGYKSAIEIPEEIRRRFSRLAGLLELADQEFISIKHALRLYVKAAPNRIKEKPQDVKIDKATLSIFLKKSTLVKQLDSKLASFCKMNIYDDMSEYMVSSSLKKLNILNVDTIKSLEDHLKSNADIVLKWGNEWLSIPNFDGDEEEESDYLDQGISVFYLCYILMAQTGNLSLISSIVQETMSRSAIDADELSVKIINTYGKYAS